MSKKKFIEGIDYCVECREPTVGSTVVKRIESGFFESSTTSMQIVVCGNEECGRFGLLSQAVRTKK